MLAWVCEFLNHWKSPPGGEINKIEKNGFGGERIMSYWKKDASGEGERERERGIKDAAFG